MTEEKRNLAQDSDLGRRINANYDAYKKSAQDALEAALECGRLLLEAKTKAGHGEWSLWLRVNTKVSARQSQKLMRLARHADELRANANSSSLFTINGALAAIADERQGDQSEEPEEEAGNGHRILAVVRSGRSKYRRPPTADHAGALNALMSDLASVHNKGQAGHLLQTIAAVCDLDISPRVAAEQFKDEAQRRDVARAAEMTLAWLRDFHREIKKPITRSNRPSLRLVDEDLP